MAETGHISIDTENILPIIKKWLYSEKEIFLRELIANASDALTKVEKMALVGELEEAPEAKIKIEVDKDNSQIRITDTGIGLTADEIRKYINQVAFSGVKEFVEKYQGKEDENQIIGHFGLGFYSAFMVADQVEIDSLSCRPGSEAAHWSCKGDTAFELTSSDRKEVGTTITLHVGEDSKDLLEAAEVKRLLKRYCAFIRFPVELDGEQINETRPLWTKSPAELKEEDYKTFYQEVFPLGGEPLFHIHLNVDYPFKLRGVLYFPKISHEYQATEGEVKLFCNQVFVEDNAKELVPEYLLVLKGVIDCPDLPLNVSRSYLQNDAQVRKISEHISKKVADKLAGMAKTERETYEQHWADLGGFVKYCMLRDSKFYERLQEHLIYKVAGTDTYTTLSDYVEDMKETSEKIIYANDEVAQAPYVNALRDHGVKVILANSMIDQHFLPYIEAQSSRKYQFQRIDADVVDHLADPAQESEIVNPQDNKTDKQKLEEVFQQYLAKGELKIKVQALKTDKVPAMLMVNEDQRRMKEMAQWMPFGAQSQEPEQTLVINSTCPAVKSVLNLSRGVNPEGDLPILVKYIYDLAVMQQGRLSPEAMSEFMERSVSVLGRLGAQ